MLGTFWERGRQTSETLTSNNSQNLDLYIKFSRSTQLLFMNWVQKHSEDRLKI